MDNDEFFEDLRQDIILRADSTENFTDEAFAEVVSEYLIDSGAIDEFVPCKFIHRGMRVDGYALKLDEALLELFVVDNRLGDKPEKMSKGEMDKVFHKAETFFEKSCLESFVTGLEVAHPAFGLARTILDQESQIKRVRFYLITNACLTNSVKELPPQIQKQREWSYRVWDLERLARTIGTGEPEEITVDFEEMFGSKLVCLPADDGKGDVRCFMAVIPGMWLSQIYDKYGGRLLEQNVRTFLQVRGKVNKGIRKTILDEPRRFFPYNNGISATAEEIVEERSGGVTYVRSLTNLQIVNGGQTTASIFNVLKKDKGASVDQVSVQMKLSVVKSEIASELVPKISRYANSQNKVSDSDFFSNHPFHVVIENISRRLSAPAKQGSQVLTHWFYERAKGQYANSTAYLSPSKKREFQARNPREQVISKTDLAKYVQTFREFPYEVCLGAQKNFAKFADHVSTLWEGHENDFNELWFRRAIAEAILFRTAEHLVLRASWYAQGYRAQVVTYGLAFLTHKIRKEGYEYDVQRIWRDQALPEAFEKIILECCKLAQDSITEGATKNNVINVSEWSKRKLCWDQIINLPLSLPNTFIQLLKTHEDEKLDVRDARIEQKGMSEAESYIAVVSAGADYWTKVRLWAEKNIDIKPSDLVLLGVASVIPKKMPSEKQCVRLNEIRLLFEGVE